MSLTLGIRLVLALLLGALLVVTLTMLGVFAGFIYTLARRAAQVFAGAVRA